MRSALTFVLAIAMCYAHAQTTVPVDLLTGRAQVSVPIWQGSQGPYSASVAIVNSGGGIRTQEGEGTAGVGWNVAAGGSVTRQVRGLPDDYNGDPNRPEDMRRGWLVLSSGSTIGAYINTFSPTSDNDVSTSGCSDEAADFAFINNLDNKKDSEPDIFSFSAPGLSGQFVFNTLGQPVPIPYQDIKIEVTGLPINVITITKNDGTKYIFNIVESTTRRAVIYKPSGGSVRHFFTNRELFQHYTKFTSSWKLSSLGGNGNAITFDYDAMEAAVPGGSSDYVVAYNAAGIPDSAYYNQDLFATRRLLSISTASQRVEFSWYNTPLRVFQVVVVDNVTSVSKTFDLNYINVKNPNAPVGSSTKIFLKSISERTNNCNSFPSYQFDYYNVIYSPNGYYAATTIPFHDEKIKQDYWGYFNDLATNIIPPVYFYSSASGSDRYRYYQNPGATLSASIAGTSNRSVNPATVMSGSLRLIRYPTGGQAEIIYEPNDYHDAAVAGTAYGPGVRVKQVIAHDSVGFAPKTIIDYEYKTTDNKSSGKWVYRSAFGYHDIQSGALYATTSDLSPESSLMYQRVVTRQSGKGSTVTEFNLPVMDPETTDSSHPDWKASHTKIARGSCLNIDKVTPGYYKMPFAPNVNYDFERGLVSRVANYNQNNQLVHERIYTYQYLATTKVVVKGLRYNMLNAVAGKTNPAQRVYAFSVYEVLANKGKVTLTETDRLADMNDLTKFHETSSTYAFSSVHHMLSHVTSANSDGKTHKTKFKYAKDFVGLTNPPGPNTKAQAVKKLNDNFMHGTVIETIRSVIDGAETVTSASLSVYDLFPDESSTLSYIWPLELKTLGNPAGFIETAVSPPSGSNQTLVHDSDYYTTTTFQDYDFYGNPLTVLAGKKSRNGIHLGYGRSLPIASIANAAASEVVYDGFESSSSFGFNIIPPGTIYPEGWSGKRALQLNPGTTIERTQVALGLGKYRFAVRVKGAAASTLTFRVYDNITQRGSAAITYSASDVGSWKYFEGVVDMGSTTTSFRLTVEATATVTIDEVRFYPETASVSTATYEPLFGKTSESDVRGNSIFYEYDALGRLRFVKDQDKTLRQQTDYFYFVQDTTSINATFTASKEPYQVRFDPFTLQGTPVTFTAPTNCIAPVTNEWFVNGVLLASGPTTFNYTFANPQKYTVMLRVSSALGSNSHSQDYDVKKIGTGNLNVNVTPLESSSYAFCDASHFKTFNAVFTGCFIEQDIQIEWFYNLGSGWVSFNHDFPPGTLSNGSKTLVFDPVLAFNGISNLAAYSIRCEVRGTCPTDDGDDIGKVYVSSFDVPITYNGSTQCQ